MNFIFGLITAYVTGVIIVLIIVFIIVFILAKLLKPKQTYTSKSRMVGCATSLPCCTIFEAFDEMPTCNVCCLQK